jgi:hypothetical protein
MPHFLDLVTFAIPLLAHWQGFNVGLVGLPLSGILVMNSAACGDVDE